MIEDKKIGEKSDEIDNDNTFEYVVKDTNNNTVLTFTTDVDGKITSWGK